MMKFMALADITVPVGYQAHPPAKHKLDLCRDFFDEFGELDRRIVVSPDGELLDGYVGYLVLLEKEIDGAYVYVHEAPPKRSYRNTETTYVAGTHGNQKHEFWWRLTAKTAESALAVPGNKALVETKYGLCTINITQVVTRNEPPVAGVIKKVLCCFPAHQKELIANE